MNKNPWLAIFARIGEAAALEQLAEEAAELSAAASKVARILRGQNPARMTYSEAFEKMVEEIADLENARDVLDSGLDVPLHSMPKLQTLRYSKMTRWYESLFGKGDGNA